MLEQLRSGNYIDLKGEKVIFSHFGYIDGKAKIYYINHIFDVIYKNEDYDIFKSIILNEDIYEILKDELKTIPFIWLDKEYSVDLEFHNIRDQDTNNRFEIWIYYNNILLKTITELHRLQNIFFELTDRQLIINF